MSSIQIHSLTFNPFQENTYILYDGTKECIIIDPGCLEDVEKAELVEFIVHEGLKPVSLINTHCHIDHILGNAFVARHFGLELAMHKEDLKILNNGEHFASMWGLDGFEKSPEPTIFLEDGDAVKFGDSLLEVRFTPGHAPGHFVLVSHDDHFVIGGDVLFRESIGRTDLPGADHETLLESIRQKLYTLPDDFEVHPGHGPSTTIGHEKANNPFVKG